MPRGLSAALARTTVVRAHSHRERRKDSHKIIPSGKKQADARLLVRRVAGGGPRPASFLVSFFIFIVFIRVQASPRRSRPSKPSPTSRHSRGPRFLFCFLGLLGGGQTRRARRESGVLGVPLETEKREEQTFAQARGDVDALERPLRRRGEKPFGELR